jgi:aldose 1-epimerase
MKTVLLLLAACAASLAANYSAGQTTENGIAVVHLADAGRGMEVTVLPSLGNRAVEFKVHGKNVLYVPSNDLAALAAKPALNGVPFLAPWANRLDSAGFWANGKRYELNAGLANYQKDNHGLPIHGLLSASNLWRVTEAAADADSAHVTSRLEFWKYPELMAQWPFAHEYEMTYRLSEGVLEVKLTVKNLSAEAMPLVFGFHPYYRIPDVPRDDWTARLAVRKAVVADNRLIPTGELKPVDLPNPLPLKNRNLDNGFTDLERDSEGRAHFSIESNGKKVEVLFGPKYPVAVVWNPPAPPGGQRDFICFEPMTAVTDAINLHHDGKYPDLQSVAAGAEWTESFWIRPSGL